MGARLGPLAYRRWRRDINGRGEINGPPLGSARVSDEARENNIGERRSLRASLCVVFHLPPQNSPRPWLVPQAAAAAMAVMAATRARSPARAASAAAAAPQKPPQCACACTTRATLSRSSGTRRAAWRTRGSRARCRRAFRSCSPTIGSRLRGRAPCAFSRAPSRAATAARRRRAMWPSQRPRACRCVRDGDLVCVGGPAAT